MSAMEYKAPDIWTDKPDFCDIAVIYEDVPSRDAAIRVSQHLSTQFAPDLELSFSWWKFKYLNDAALAAEAAEAASQADLVVFATRSDRALPVEVKDWVERWLPWRIGRDGAITALTTEAQHPDFHSSPLGEYLASISRRAGLEVISASNLMNQDAWSNIRTREREVTPVLDEILHQTHPMSHWGLNE
jgi:hypothetical protein